MHQTEYLSFASFKNATAYLRFCPLFFILCLLQSCHLKEEPASVRNQARAIATLDSICKYYSVPKTNDLIEDFYPNQDGLIDTLNTDEHQPDQNLFAHLCPYTGMFSCVNVLVNVTKNEKYTAFLTSRVMKGLDSYFDPNRIPFGYCSAVNKGLPNTSDRFYDDNIGLAIYFLEAYAMNKKEAYLTKAKRLWQFAESGMDEKLGGGIYWSEQSRESKNTCVNSSASVLAFKLFEATKDSLYFHQGKKIFEWTKTHLQDPKDHLYFDNIRLDGSMSKSKFSYNNGYMMHASVLLYKLTGDSTYLKEAQVIAQSAYNFYFFDYKLTDGSLFRMKKKGSTWFTAILLRGYVDLYKVDGNKTYLTVFQKNLDYIWDHGRDQNGFFSTDWSKNSQHCRKWILTQTAFVEMYARMSLVNL